MTRLTKILAAVAFSSSLILPSLSQAGVRVYIRIGPPKVRTVRIVKPTKSFRNSVWVAGHYRYTRARYVYVKGYWVKPRVGYVYIQPRWKKTNRGYFFVPGRWKKL